MLLIQLFFLLTYIAVAVAVGYAAIRYVSAESVMTREFKVSVKARLARITSMYRLSSLILKKPFTYLVLVAVITSVIISGLNTSYENNLVVVHDPSVAGGTYDLMIRFKDPVSVDACVLVLRYVNTSRHCVKYYRTVLDPPYTLEGGRELIYVLIGVEDPVLRSLGFREGLPDLTFIYSEVAGGFAADYIKTDKGVVEIRLLHVGSDLLKNYDMFYSTPLVPVQGYMGTEPIIIPLQHVLISSLTNVLKLRGESSALVTDVVVMEVNRYVNPPEIYDLVNQHYPVAEVVVAGNGSITYLSEVRVPTKDSIISALISSVTASVVIISIFSSTTPYLRELRNRILFMGFPPWAITVIIVGYTLMSILIPGLAALTFVFMFMGGVAMLNSVVTLILAWVVSTTYISLRVRPEKLITEAYVPPTPRYVLMTSLRDVRGLAEVIVNLIKTNEFFQTEDVELRVEGDEAFIYARMDYVDSWGSGVDITVFITLTEGGAHANISSMVFGVEEVSEAMSRSINALAISRIIGGVRTWETAYR